MNCIIHEERIATHTFNVPCSFNGKVGICTECNRLYQEGEPDILKRTFTAYQTGKHSAHGQTIRQRRAMIQQRN